MQLHVSTTRWKRLLRLFVEKDGEGIENLTRVLDHCLESNAPTDADPVKRTWSDMRAVVESVIEAGMKDQPGRRLKRRK